MSKKAIVGALFFLGTSFTLPLSTAGAACPPYDKDSAAWFLVRWEETHFGHFAKKEFLHEADSTKRWRAKNVPCSFTTYSMGIGKHERFIWKSVRANGATAYSLLTDKGHWVSGTRIEERAEYSNVSKVLRVTLFNSAGAVIAERKIPITPAMLERQFTIEQEK